MAKDDQQEAFERVLTSSLARVIDFVKYAEAKNAALITFSSAWLLALYNRSNTPPASRLHAFSFQTAQIAFAFALFIALWSFLPRRKLPKFHKDPEQLRSLVYFGDAATFDPTSYISRVRERYLPAAEQSETARYIDDLAVQIAVNSRIANRKFTLFHIGAMIVVLGLILLAVPSTYDLMRVVVIFLHSVIV